MRRPSFPTVIPSGPAGPAGAPASAAVEPWRALTFVGSLPNGEIVFVAGATAESDYTSLDNISFWTD